MVQQCLGRFARSTASRSSPRAGGLVVGLHDAPGHRHRRGCRRRYQWWFRPIARSLARLATRWSLNDPGVLAQTVGAFAVVWLALIWEFRRRTGVSQGQRRRGAIGGVAGRSNPARLCVSSRVDAHAVRSSPRSSGAAALAMRADIKSLDHRAPRHHPGRTVVMARPMRIIWRQIERIAFGASVTVSSAVEKEALIYCPIKTRMEPGGQATIRDPTDPASSGASFQRQGEPANEVGVKLILSIGWPQR